MYVFFYKTSYDALDYPGEPWYLCWKCNWLFDNEISTRYDVIGDETNCRFASGFSQGLMRLWNLIDASTVP